MPPLPTPHAAAALLLTLIVIALFATNRMRVELICLGLIAVLALGFHLFPLVQEGRFTGMDVAFGGFGHSALVAICCLMILGRGLVATGALDPAARALSRLWSFSKILGMLLSLLVCGALSMFINDTPVLVLTLPMLLGLAHRAGVAASKTLMPVNCAILIGGMCTTIGTSTNLLVVSLAQDLGLEPIGMFAFTDIALTAAVVALPYLWFVMPRLLPDGGTGSAELPRKYDSSLHIMTNSRGIGQPVSALLTKQLNTVECSGILRGGNSLQISDSVLLEADDHLLIRGTATQLREASETMKATLADPKIIAAVHAPAGNSEGQRIAEMVVGGDSNLIGHSVVEARIADKYQVAALGTSRSITTPWRHRSPTDASLEVGDVLLVQGTPSKLRDMEMGEGAMQLEGGIDLPHSHKSLWAIVIVTGVVLLASLKILPIAIAALAGTIAMIATGCLKYDGIGRALSLEVIVLIAASIALGRALSETGAAEWLGSMFATGLGSMPPAVVVGALMAFTTVLTNFVSNAAAATIGTPLAVSLAQALGIPAEPLVLAVLFGCNLCYVTPMAYQTNLIIMGAARYRFSDFVRAGLPLALLMIVTLAYLLVQRYNL
jgi:di/tricarboxylate transporter